MRPDEGHIETKGSCQGLLELNTGMHPELMGRENILVGGVVAGLTRREVQSQLDAIVAFAELEAFIDSPVRTYSTGMRMRLGFAVAAHSRPDVLLIDEVLSVGDLAFQNKCLDRIRHFKTPEGCAIVLISHDLGQVEALCDEGLWLKQGRVVSRGSPKVLRGRVPERDDRVTQRRRRPTYPSVSAPEASCCAPTRTASVRSKWRSPRSAFSMTATCRSAFPVRHAITWRSATRQRSAQSRRLFGIFSGTRRSEITYGLAFESDRILCRRRQATMS